MRTGFITIILLLNSLSINAAQLVPGVYQLLDHPGGSASPPPYGLRLDDLQPPVGVGPTFSTVLNGAQSLLTWDGGDLAVISGTLRNNTTGLLWSVTHNLSGISSTSEGFFATQGTMILEDTSAGTTYTIDSKAAANGAVFEAFGDSHRCGYSTDCGPFVGRGWLEPGVTDYKAKYNDWLVQLVEVPIPGALLLFLSALIGLRVYARK